MAYKVLGANKDFLPKQSDCVKRESFKMLGTS